MTWILFALSAGLLAYVAVGYPLLLMAIVRLRGERPIRRADATPPLTLLISAYNERAVIRSKLENALSLDYPRDRLEIVVVSDASTDGTDAIVAEFASHGVTLVRQPERRGKTAGLNAVVPAARGEVIVFSDANALYEHDALRMLVRNLADPEVGCVTGEARYRPGGRRTADVGEGVYWNLELNLKRLETGVGSTVGGDGAIYAIRRELWQPLPAAAINDFLNPLQIVAAGWRSVYEPKAVCYESAAGVTRAEYRRRVRIVSRSWRAVFQAPAALNPFRVGFFAVSLVSHKVLRWFAPVLLLVACASGGALLWPYVAQHLVQVGVLALIAVLAGLVFPPVRRGFALAGYFATLGAASIVGLVRGTLNRVSGIWAPPRESDVLDAPPREGSALLLWSPVLTILGLGALAASFWDTPAALDLVFVVASGLIAYVYVGYPVVLALLRRLAADPIAPGDSTPEVTVLVAANDEARVIEAKIRNTLTLDYPAGSLRLVVVSDGSVDDTAAIARRFEPDGVTVVEILERRGKTAALNDGMSRVRTDIVVLTDANTMLEAGAVRALVRNLADSRVGAVSGDVILMGERASLARSEDLYYRYERWLQRVESQIGSMPGVDGALYAIRRTLYEPPPDDTVLDDMAIPMAVVRRGFRVVLEPEARAYEVGSTSAWMEFARRVRITAGAVQFIRRQSGLGALRDWRMSLALVSHKVLRWLSPVFAILLLASAAVQAAGSTIHGAVTAVLVGVAALGLVGCSTRFRGLKPVAFMHYLCLVETAALAGLLRGTLGRPPSKWRRFARSPAVTS